MFKKHFALYGPMDFFQLHKKPSYCYGFIQYKSVYSAAAALRSTHHFVSGYRIKVTVADSWHQPTSQEDDIAQNDSSQDGESQQANRQLHVLDLNDDCLLEIFSYLNCIDLSACNQTSVRFSQIAGEVFRKKHTSINLTDTVLGEYSNVGSSHLTLLQIRNLFVSFGSQIRKLKVASMSFKEENRYRVLDLIMRSCAQLRALCLTGFSIKESLYKPGNTFFYNLEELSLSLCELNDSIRRVFVQCHSLRKLTIQSDSNLNGSCLAMQFPRLESITLIMNSDIETQNLYTFFRLNPQLIAIKIFHCGGCIFDEIFPKIANLLPNLESLSIEVDYFQNFVSNIMHLLRLDKLKELQLNCSMYSIASFIDELAKKDTIEVLHLSDGLLNDHLIDALVKCKRLKSLKLCSMPSVHNRFLVELAKNLPLTSFHVSKCQTLTASGIIQFASLATNLKNLYITNSSFEINDQFYHNLVDIYKKRNTQLTLSLVKMNPKVLPQTIEENKRFVELLRPNDACLYDVYGDEFSEMDSDDDDDDDDDEYHNFSDDDWENDSSFNELFDDDFDFDFNQWKFY